MDINYFINILQQNTETIKQLNERIKLLEEINLLEKSEKEDNLTTLIKDVQLMKLKESNKNKQLKEQIELLENENKQLKKQMEKTNANMIKYCDVIKTLEYQSTKQRERICSLEQGFKQLKERDKLVKDTIVEFKENVTSIRNNLDDVIDSLLDERNYITEYAKRNKITKTAGNTKIYNSNQEVITFANINKYNHITSYTVVIGIVQHRVLKETVDNTRRQLFNDIKQYAPYNTITSLTICDELYSKEYKRTGDSCYDHTEEIVKSYCYKFDINFLTYFPNLQTLIVKGYGLYGLLDCLTTAKHKLTEINLNDYYLALENDKEITGIEEYCKMNKIKFSLTYSREKVIYRKFLCSTCVGVRHVDNLLRVELFA
jgi:hypothetical protein